MPLLVTVKEWGLGARPKATTAPAAKKQPVAKPRSVSAIEDQLRRLGSFPMVSGPYDADDYDALTRRRLDWSSQRSRLLEELRLAKQRTDTDRLQARNAPTEEIAVDDPEAKKKARQNATRVRQSEAWRYKQLDQVQRQAEVEMGLALKSRTSGLGAAVSKYGAVGGGRAAFDVSAAIDATWREWCEKAKPRKINIPAIIDCIAEPLTLGDVERAHRLDNGGALANYQRGLDLWSELRGWTRRIDPVHDAHAIS